MTSSDMSMKRLVNNEEAWVSAAIFSHPDIYQQELEQIFARTWLFVGHESQIPNPGDFVRSRMGEEQVILTRGRDNKIYVLLNSCSHRGNMVCRYDEGHGLAFQCSFHGWTFSSDGKLINLPPGTEEAYAPDLRKDEWGLLSARVETFQGTVWANWDKNAPGLREFFGGAATYLSAGLSDAEGNPDGTELAGGVMRWRVGLNWKVPMPDLDTTHGWITHRSARGPVSGFGFGGGGTKKGRCPVLAETPPIGYPQHCAASVRRAPQRVAPSRLLRSAPGASNGRKSDGPWTHASASLLTPARLHSPVGPLLINLPTAEGGVRLLQDHRHLPNPSVDTPAP